MTWPQAVLFQLTLATRDPILPVSTDIRRADLQSVRENATSKYIKMKDCHAQVSDLVS